MEAEAAQKERRYRCAACGPSSLHGNGDRIMELECFGDGWSAEDFEKYCACRSCRRKISIACLEEMANAYCEFAKTIGDLIVHDEMGAWQLLADRPWRARVATATFKPFSQAKRLPGELSSCIFCEDGEMPGDMRAVPEEFFTISPDVDGPFNSLASAFRCMPDGSDGDVINCHMETWRQWPIVDPLDARAAFEGDHGEHGSGKLLVTPLSNAPARPPVAIS